MMTTTEPTKTSFPRFCTKPCEIPGNGVRTRDVDRLFCVHGLINSCWQFRVNEHKTVISTILLYIQMNPEKHAHLLI